MVLLGAHFFMIQNDPMGTQHLSDSSCTLKVEKVFIVKYPFFFLDLLTAHKELKFNQKYRSAQPCLKMKSG